MAMNSWAVLLVAIVAVGILVSRAAAADPAAAGPTVDELRRGVAAQEAALRSYKFSCHIDTLVSYNGKNIDFVRGRPACCSWASRRPTTGFSLAFDRRLLKGSSIRSPSAKAGVSRTANSRK